MSRRDLLRRMFAAAVEAAHPDHVLSPHFPPPPRGRLIVLAAGKAAGASALAAERHYADLPPGRLVGIAVTRHGHGRPCRHIEMIEAGHPVPDEAGLRGTGAALALAAGAGADDLVLVLLSGGGSANWVAPAEGLSLADKQAVTRALLRSGAPIAGINTVRKHLSRIKGGRLLLAAAPAPVVTLAISDVPGDDPAAIASGPTVPDRTTLADARAVIARYGIAPGEAVARALDDVRNETVKPGDPRLAGSEYRIVARAAGALAAAAATALDAGYEVVDLGTELEGEAREVAMVHAALARELRAAGRRAVILSGGELTVTVRGEGRGGPNQEYALALAIALDGLPGVAALAADTDGADGGGGVASDPAGAMLDEHTIRRAGRLGLVPARFLANNDSTSFFEALGDLVSTGPTFTNVNDFRAVIVDFGSSGRLNR